MPLAEFLSAVRQLVMDVDELPGEEGERRTLYGDYFPGLTSSEVDDLARIPPEKLRIYTGTIFNGERAILRNHFACSVEVLRRVSTTLTPESPFQLAGFIHDLHRVRPWMSYRVDDFAVNYVGYVRSDLPELLRIEPALEDLVQLEFSTLQIKRARDSFPSARDSVSAEILETTAVDDFLAMELCLTPEATLHRFEFDVVSVFQHFQKYRELKLPFVREVGFFAGGRNRDLFPRWSRISKFAFEFLGAKDVFEVFSVEEFAMAFVRAAPPEQSEEEVFLGLTRQIVSLSQCGVLLLLEPDSTLLSDSRHKRREAAPH